MNFLQTFFCSMRWLKSAFAARWIASAATLDAGADLTYFLSSILSAPIAQLDRAPDYGSGGLGFESLWVRHFYKLLQCNDLR